MKRCKIGSNMTVLNFVNGDSWMNRTAVLYSYDTPVAGYDHKGAFKTAQWYSSTTTRHVNKYTAGDQARVVEQSYIDQLVSEATRTYG